VCSSAWIEQWRLLAAVGTGCSTRATKASAKHIPSTQTPVDVLRLQSRSKEFTSLSTACAQLLAGCKKRETSILRTHAPFELQKLVYFEKRERLLTLCSNGDLNAGPLDYKSSALPLSYSSMDTERKKPSQLPCPPANYVVSIHPNESRDVPQPGTESWRMCNPMPINRRCVTPSKSSVCAGDVYTCCFPGMC
jgi:hypothetical protein